MDEIQVNGNDEALPFDVDNGDPFAVPPPLGDLGPLLDDDPADIEAGQYEEVNPQDNVAADATQESEGKKKKKRALKPRVNLNEERLCSKKGIEALKYLCSDVQFKGKGHEVSDLNKLLHRFEHWAQCLMPRWPFNNVVEKCEVLGKNSRVKNELKRIRRNEDETLREEPEDVDEDTAVVDEVMDGEQPLEPTTQEDVSPEERTPAQLTEEQLERIRQNRELAFARRDANKRRKLEESQTESQLEEAPSAEQPTNAKPGDVQEIPREAPKDLANNNQHHDTIDNINDDIDFNGLSEIDGIIESQNNNSEMNGSFQTSSLNITRQQEVDDHKLDNDILNETDNILEPNPNHQDIALSMDTSNVQDLNTKEDDHSNAKTENNAPITENGRPETDSPSSENAVDDIANSSVATEQTALLNPKDNCIASTENSDATSVGQMDLDESATK